MNGLQDHHTLGFWDLTFYQFKFNQLLTALWSEGCDIFINFVKCRGSPVLIYFVHTHIKYCWMYSFQVNLHKFKHYQHIVTHPHGSDLDFGRLWSDSPPEFSSKRIFSVYGDKWKTMYLFCHNAKGLPLSTVQL